MILCCGIVTESCKKSILDLKPLNALSDAAVWNDLTLTQAYVTQNYNALFDWNWAMYDPNGNYSFAYASSYAWMWSSATDESFEHLDSWFGTPSAILTGTISSNNETTYNRWPDNYSDISAINTFFSHIDQVPGDDTTKNKLKGQMYFLRAFCYNELLKRFGGVPIIDQVLPLQSSYNQKRATFDETVAFIQKDLQSAASLLPLTYSDADQGRITKGAALALLSNVLLYAASPLNNPNHDNTKWQAAADAAKAVFALGQYTLYKPANYANIFLDNANPEVILARYYNNTAGDYTTTNFENTINRDLSPCSYSGWGFATPIQNLIDDYQMADGTAFDWNNPVEAAHPYANREPRFYATIFYDGAPYQGSTVDTYTGGKDSPSGATVEQGNATQTGYYVRKFVYDNWNVATSGYAQNNMVVIIRLAEIYLNYAEASAELGDEGDALTYLNMIRSRAGLPSATASGSALIDAIMHERRIELAFEGKRYFDVRRRNILDQASGNAIGMTITKNIDGSKTYTRFTLQTRSYNQKTYWFPIPYSETSTDANLAQNPGY